MAKKKASHSTETGSGSNRAGGNEARLDELGKDPGQLGPRSAGQSGGPQRLSSMADASAESVEELVDTDQALESAAVEGSEDAADHPERPTHTHAEYGRPDDLPPSLSGVRSRLEPWASRHVPHKARKGAPRFRAAYAFRPDMAYLHTQSAPSRSPLNG